MNNILNLREMALIIIETAPYLQGGAKLEGPLVGFSKAGRINFLPRAATDMGLKDGDGIEFAFDPDKGAVYVRKQMVSAMRLKKRQGGIGLQNQRFSEYLRTLLKVAHDDKFRAVLEPVQLGQQWWHQMRPLN